MKQIIENGVIFEAPTKQRALQLYANHFGCNYELKEEEVWDD